MERTVGFDVGVSNLDHLNLEEGKPVGWGRATLTLISGRKNGRVHVTFTCPNGETPLEIN